ncbi:M48 family metallopeptidase [Patescibacteria group bacterium]
MEKIVVNGKEIEYTIKKSKRAKRMILSISRNAELVVTLPYRGISVNIVEKFIRDKSSWIIKKIDFLKNKSEKMVLPENYQECKIKVHQFAKERTDFYNKLYGLKYNRIIVKNHGHRWGSCSIRRNLNFNYRIMFLPLELADYIVVHELCHLKEMNHSKNFWQLVAKVFPDHKILRKELRKMVF